MYQTVKTNMAKLHVSTYILVASMVFSACLGGTWASDPQLTTDFGINVTSGADLKFSNFRVGNVPDSAPGQMNILFAFNKQFPGITGLGLGGALLKFGPNTVNVLHTHPRGNELLWLLEGRIDVGIVDTSNNLFTSTLEPGEIFVFPMGLLHYQINRGRKPATAIAVFSSENAGRLNFPTAIFNSVPHIPEDVVGNSFDLDANTVERLYNIKFPSA